MDRIATISCTTPSGHLIYRPTYKYGRPVKQRRCSASGTICSAKSTSRDPKQPCAAIGNRHLRASPACQQTSRDSERATYPLLSAVVFHQVFVAGNVAGLKIMVRMLQPTRESDCLSDRSTDASRPNRRASCHEGRSPNGLRHQADSQAQIRWLVVDRGEQPR